MRRFTFLALLLALSLVSSGQAPTKKKIAKDECGADWGIVVGGGPYRCADGKWVLDEAAAKREREYVEQHNSARRELYWALRTRELSDAEMAKVKSLDYSLLIELCPHGCSYNEAAIKAEFNAALMQQYQIRESARKTPKPDHCPVCGQSAEKYVRQRVPDLTRNCVVISPGEVDCPTALSGNPSRITRCRRCNTAFWQDGEEGKK